MRRGVLILLILTILLPTVLATTTVTLNSPDDSNTTSISTVIFNCTVSDDTYDIASVKLFTDTSGSWAQTESTVSGNVATAQFSVSSISNGAYSWNCLAENTNGNTTYATSNRTFTVSASSSSFSGTIPDQTWDEDTTKTNAFDLDDYFTGATSYSYSGNDKITITINTTNEVTFTPQANFSGNETITFTSNTGDTSNSIVLSVTNINDPPFIADEFFDLTTNKNTNITINMSEHFEDPDPLNELSYTLFASQFTATQDGDMLTIAPEKDWEGSEEVTIRATDGSTVLESNVFSITVGENSAPTIRSTSHNDQTTISPGENIDLSITLEDAEDDQLSYTWFIDEDEQTETTNTLSFSSLIEGSFNIKIEVSDGSNTISQEWTVTVGEKEQEVTVAVTACGNGIIEEGENCSTCALDVKCSKRENCVQGICKARGNPSKAIAKFFVIIILVIGIAALAYYFTTLNKGKGNKPLQESQGNFYNKR
jgi:hypothetical protein